MTSTTAAHSAQELLAPEVFAEIEALFSWNPPPLKPAQVKSSAATRLPAFYDKHISAKLAVKNVVPLPSLLQDLADNVDNVLKATSNALPRHLKGLITAEQRVHDLRNLSKTMKNETAVADFYHMTTARFCLATASMLALHPSYREWQSLLSWTKSGPSTPYAIMDGLLCFVDEGDGRDKLERDDMVNCIDSQYRAIFEEVRNQELPLATWEMKSLRTGSSDVMAAIHILGEFHWTFCDTKNCKKAHQKVRLNAEKAGAGPDAQAPPWNISEENNIPVLVENRGEGTSTHPMQKPDTRRSVRLAAVPDSAALALQSSGVSHSQAHSTMDKGKKRQQDDETYQDRLDTTAQSWSGSLSPPSEDVSPTNNKGKKRKLDDETYHDQHDITAERIVQHAWAQAVRIDGTIIVIHSGNQELVCVRHRDSQTLYVSEIIEPSTRSNPGYGKLHIGIYIAAIQDMMDRQLQLSQSKPTGGGDDDLIGGSKDQDDQDHNRGSGSGRKGRDRKDGHGARRGIPRDRRGRFQSSSGTRGRTENEAIEKAIAVANDRDVVYLYLQYNIYNSEVPASFLRSAPSIMAHTKCPPRAIHSYGLEECMTIVLTSEIGHGATGVVHRGILKPEPQDDVTPLDVVVKLAFNDEQREALKCEYEFYRCLKSKGVHQGIARALGIFDDCEGCACALVLLYAGIPISESPSKLSVSDRESALSTLKSIHRAGILHKDIRQVNIVIGDLGITIIDFGHSEESDDQGAKDRELVQLRHCLRSVGKND